MSDLQIADDFAFPLDYATRRIAMLATSGAGKSNASVVLAERLYAAKVPWYAIDPKGDWWGARSSGDGTKPGLSVPIFGGIHGDIPLEATAGKVIAEAIVSHRLSCVIDVSQFDGRQPQLGFLADFAETMLRRNTEPMHGFLDECHTYIPQQSRDKGQGLRCLGAWERLIGQGRNKGLGTTQISQRSALVNKNTLDLVDCMVALRCISPRDLDAIDGWMASRLEAGDRKALLATLPTLANGEAYVYAPEWMPGPPRRIRFNRRWTFDSAATPEVGKSVTPPSTLADIDLAALGGRIAETVERQKADDPKALKAEIARLRREASHAPAATVDTAEVERLAAERDALRAEANRRGVLLQRAEDVISRIGQQVEAHDAVNAADADATMPMPAPALVAAPRPARTRTEARTTTTETALSDYQRDILTAVAQRHPAPSTRAQVATLSRKSIKSSMFAPALRALADAGFISGTDRIAITDVGFDVLGGYEAPPTGAALLDWWLVRVSAAEAVFLRVIAHAYPRALSREEIAAESGRSLTSSQFNPTLRGLVDRELITETERGVYRAADELGGA